MKNILLALLIIITSGCCGGIGTTHEDTRPIAVDQDTELRKFVEDTIFFPQVRFNRTEEEYIELKKWADKLRDRRKQFNTKEMMRIREITLTYIKPRYTDVVFSRIFQLLYARDEGSPELRKWLKENIITWQYAKVVSQMPYRVPEIFDIYEYWIRHQDPNDPESVVAKLRPAGPYIQRPIYWYNWDQAAENMRYIYRDFMPNIPKYDHHTIWHKDTEEKRKIVDQWREHIVKWLDDHPEARSWWIQRYYYSYKKRLDRSITQFPVKKRNFVSYEKSFLEHKKENPTDIDSEKYLWLKESYEKYKLAVHSLTQSIPQLESTLISLEQEFPEELADRRGICKDMDWGKYSF